MYDENPCDTAERSIQVTADAPAFKELAEEEHPVANLEQAAKHLLTAEAAITDAVKLLEPPPPKASLEQLMAAINNLPPAERANVLNLLKAKS